MKILFIPAPQEKQTFARTPLVYRALAKKHEVFGICSSNSFLSKIKAYNEAKKILKSQKIGLIFCEQPENAFIGAILATKFGKPLFFDSHGSVKLFSDSLGKNLFYRKMFGFFEKQACDIATAVTTVSETDKKELQKHSGNNKKFFVVPTWIDNGRIKKTAKKKAREALGFDTAKKHLLFFGSLDYAPNQGAVNFISEKLAPALESENCIIHICGSGKLRAKRAKNIAFHGFVQDIVSFINASDAVIAPIWKGVGILEKVLLPMACGKTVIATKLAKAGIPELQDNENALVAGSETDFAKKTIQFVEGKYDNEKIGKNAEELIKEKYAGTNEKKLLEIIEAAAK